MAGGLAAWAVMAAVLWRGVLAEPAAVAWERRPVRIVEAVDGQTLRVAAGEADAAEPPEAAVRLMGVSVREGQSEGARRELERLVGRRVMISFDSRRWRDGRGQLLGYVYSAEGRMLNEWLIRRGLARCTEEPHGLSDWFARLEGQARMRGWGQWADE